LKKSIALFAVLAFLIVVFALLNTIFKIYEDYSKNSNNFYQTTVLIKNIFDILNTISKDINETNFKFIFTTIPISSKDGNFREVIKIKPLFDKINLNEYLQNNKINPSIDMFLNNLFEKYNILDPQYFKDLLLDSLDKDDLERSPDTEKLNINSKIYNYKQFQKIINFYAQKKNDKSIYKISFNKYIYFYPDKTPLICEILDKNLNNLLNIKNLDCKNLSNINKKILNDLDIITFKSAKIFFVKISTNEFNMTYDLKQKRIIKFENNPVY